jgi:hypothetical protein
MNFIFADMLDIFVIVYLDDILVFSTTVEEHTDHVRRVLARLRESGLFAKPEKCEFSTPSTAFLGFVISATGIDMDESKVKSIFEWPIPRNLRDVQSFLGFTNFYRRFIKEYSLIASPLTSLTRKDTPFVWSDECEEAFQSLKRSFTSASLLRHYDPTRPAIVETDASGYAIAAVLSQYFDNRLHPVAFLSRKLTGSERNWEIHDKELYAILAAFEEWHHYLVGSPHPIEVVTDHQSLQYFATKRRLNDRQARWHQFLAPFKYVIRHRPGRLAGKPDSLSRRADYRPSADGDEEDHNNFVFFKPEQLVAAAGLIAITPSLLEEIRQAQEHDPFVQRLGESLPSPFSFDPEGLVRHNDAIYIPDTNNLRLRVTQDRHDTFAAGHPGRDKTTSLVLRDYWWPNLRNFVARFVASCDLCQRVKRPRHSPYGLLRPLPIASRPWSSLSFDLIEGLPPSDGFDTLLVVVDRFTKMIVLIPCHRNLNAEKLADLFVKHVWCKYGLPDTLVSDRAPEFVSRFWRRVCLLLKIAPKYSVAHHPQTDGQTERINQIVEQFIRFFVNERQDDWASLLPFASFAYNNSPHSATGLTPFFANYGFHPRFDFAPSPPSTNSKAADARVSSLQKLRSTISSLLQRANDKAAKYYNRHHTSPPLFTPASGDYPGDLVMLSTKNLNPKKHPKFAHRYIGPFHVLAKVNDNSYRLALPPPMRRINPTFNIASLEPYVSDDLTNRLQPDLPPEELDEEASPYLVERIHQSRVNKRRRPPTLEYLVEWQGYPLKKDFTWQPVDSLDIEKIDDLVEEFHHDNPEAPRSP